MTSYYSDDGAFRSVLCDGLINTRACGRILEGGTGDRLSDLRAQGRKEGWRRVRIAGGEYVDLCPWCSDTP